MPCRVISLGLPLSVKSRLKSSLKLAIFPSRLGSHSSWCSDLDIMRVKEMLKTNLVFVGMRRATALQVSSEANSLEKRIRRKLPIKQRCRSQVHSALPTHFFPHTGSSNVEVSCIFRFRCEVHCDRWHFTVNANPLQRQATGGVICKGGDLTL